MIDLILTKTAEILVGMGYWGVFFSAMGIFPTEVVITLFAASKTSSMWLIAVVSSLGAVIGGIPTYFLGYIFREDLLYKWLNTKGSFLGIDTNKIEESKRKIRKHAFWYLFLTKFVPWLRVAANIAAGYVRIGLLQYILATFFGMFLYTVILALIGIEAGESWDEINRYINMLDKGTVTIIIAILLTYFLYKSKKKVISKVRDSERDTIDSKQSKY
ncbi:MAG: DedA family protein [Candidatus Dojkabacteria bacterium]